MTLTWLDFSCEIHRVYNWARVSTIWLEFRIFKIYHPCRNTHSYDLVLIGLTSNVCVNIFMRKPCFKISTFNCFPIINRDVATVFFYKHFIKINIYRFLHFFFMGLEEYLTLSLLSSRDYSNEAIIYVIYSHTYSFIRS